MSSNSPTGSDPELINHSSADITHQSQSAEYEDAEAPQRPPTLSRASTASREKCWICLATKDEDPPSPPNPPTEWRSPCSCSLQAHEACLLDWVADQESPRSRTGGGRSGPTPEKILCPQCRSEIKIQRPFDPLVQMCRAIDRQYSRVILPGLLGSVVGTLLAGCWAHGRLATYLVFGHDHDEQLFLYALHAGHGRVFSYAFIPISLIFSRTKWADFVVPAGTLTLISTQLPANLDGPLINIDGPYWPPLPSTVFAVLPTVKTFYDWAYEQCFGELNRKWLEAIKPRREEGYDGHEDNIPGILNEAEAAEEPIGDGPGMVLELEVNLGAGNGQIEGADAAGDDAGAEGGAQNAQQENNANEQQPRIHRVFGNNEFLDDDTTIGPLVVGSLLLPAAASIAGEALKLLLPTSWSSPRWNFYPASGRVGFLATKWGRSVVGGLAFCAVKDMLVLYCRWRLAESHKKRRIMNFDKAKKEYISGR